MNCSFTTFTKKILIRTCSVKRNFFFYIKVQEKILKINNDFEIDFFNLSTLRLKRAYFDLMFVYEVLNCMIGSPDLLACIARSANGNGTFTCVFDLQTHIRIWSNDMIFGPKMCF